MKKILIVYNCCGISGKENIDYYLKAIASINNQDFGKQDELIISGCCLSAETKRKLLMQHNDVLLIDEVHPVNVTFNKAVDVGIQKYGTFDSYLYVDSGSIFPGHNVLTTLKEYLEDGRYGMITPQPSCDTEYYGGLKVGRYRGDDEYARQVLFANGDYLIPPGKGMATHVNLITEEMRSFYGRCYPDIFASHCTEGNFGFMCAALKKQWVLLKDIIIEQSVSLDGQSSGFSPAAWQSTGRPMWDHPYRVNSIVDRLCTAEAYELGFGYEECNGIFPHDVLHYDENYFCENDYLKEFIKENLFLTKEELDYEAIPYVLS